VFTAAFSYELYAGRLRKTEKGIKFVKEGD